jgi:hypothetical protein
MLPILPQSLCFPQHLGHIVRIWSAQPFDKAVFAVYTLYRE